MVSSDQSPCSLCNIIKLIIPPSQQIAKKKQKPRHDLPSPGPVTHARIPNSKFHNHGWCKGSSCPIPQKSPADIEVTERDIPKAIPGTAVVQIIAAGIGPGHGYLVTHDVPGFSFPVPSVYGSNAVDRVVSVGSDSVSIKEGQLVTVDPFATARDDPNVEIIVGLMDSGENKAKTFASDTWLDDCWQTHAVVPLENAVPLDEEVLVGKHGYDIEELTVIVRLSVAYGAISNVDIKAGEIVIVGPATGQFGGAAVKSHLL